MTTEIPPGEPFSSHKNGNNDGVVGAGEISGTGHRRMSKG